VTAQPTNDNCPKSSHHQLHPSIPLGTSAMYSSGQAAVTGVNSASRMQLQQQVPALQFQSQRRRLGARRIRFRTSSSLPKLPKQRKSKKKRLGLASVLVFAAVLTVLCQLCHLLRLLRLHSPTEKPISALALLLDHSQDETAVLVLNETVLHQTE